MKVGKIEKGIPIRRSIYLRYPFKEMVVGDSFLVQAEKGEELRTILQRLQPSKRSAESSTGHKFICRTVKDENGVRVWRIE